MDIRGKVTLITGASEGIGAACAAAFRERGALLALNARSETKLASMSGPDTLILPGDITEPTVQERVVQATVARFGRIDILINNAGAGLYTPSWVAPMEQARALFELNFFAALRMIQLVTPHMRERRSGMIVNISSIAGRITLPWFTLYSASKYALCSLSDGLRMELKSDGIQVITVCPGYVNTGFQSHIIGGKVPPALVSSRRFAIPVEACARAIAQGVERNRRTVMAPRMGWLLVAMARLFPRLVDAQLERIYSRRAEGATVK